MMALLAGLGEEGMCGLIMRGERFEPLLRGIALCCALRAAFTPSPSLCNTTCCEAPRTRYAMN